jgi:hypothetical protein
MTLTLDTNQQRFGALPFDHMSSYSSSSSPQFTNPWSSTASTAPTTSHALYPGLNAHHNPNLGLDSLKQQAVRAGTGSSYGAIPVTSASAGSAPVALSFGRQDLLTMPQDLLSLNRLQNAPASYGDAAYTTASPVHPSYAAVAPANYDALSYSGAPLRSGYALAAPEADNTRRFSQSSVPPRSLPITPSIPLPGSIIRTHQLTFHHSGLQADDRRSFADAIDASHGMLAMSQETPRNIYGNRSDRSSTDSYGFPSAHSTSSSISSGNFSYYGGADSVSDYSTAGSDIESATSRTLPRPSSLMTSQVPPAPQSMMGQFSSKVSSSTQKKHKCKVCDKRFTRPSSLQTHMYSHTGEKRQSPHSPTTK